MSWGRNDPGFPPSPDPAAEAERYYSEQERYASPDDDCGGDCDSCDRCRAELERQELAEAQRLTEHPEVTVDEEEIPF